MNKPTATYEQYEIVKVPFPFADIKSSKIRPAIILSSATSFNGKIGLSIMAMITSLKPVQDLWPSDIIIQDLKEAGLSVPSLIRFKCFTLDSRLILGSLGDLSDLDRKEVKRKLKEILAL